MDIKNTKYSVLLAGKNYSKVELEKLLLDGKKIIWFGTELDNKKINADFNEFVKSGFLNIYKNIHNNNIEIIDGEYSESQESVLKDLEFGDENFNLDQYEIEHMKADANIIVEAGAGTGKTHVMINRVLFLMHVVEDFSFENVAMITFTNKATDNMRHRLTNTLYEKYRLTGKKEYIERIEELSQITLSTIHSFFKQIIVEVGPILGYGNNVNLRSFVLEKRNILRDLLDEQYGDSNKRVIDVLGLAINDIEKLAKEYWEKLDNKGLVGKDIVKLNWGVVEDNNALHIQETLLKIFDEVYERYNNSKYENNGISMQDIIHELGRVIKSEKIKDYITSNYKFIFCDEFQDSDDVQIQTISMLNNMYGSSLFVVGDIKQSIYRFRGATDSAFIKLDKCLANEDKERLVYKSLTKNYRTSKDILDRLDSIFIEWGVNELLEYKRKDKLIPQIMDKGEYVQIPIKEKFHEQQFVSLIYKIKEKPNNRITVLTRTNNELTKIRRWCEEAQIVCLIKERGTFYVSPAVLDFCAVLEAFEFCDEPMYLFNFVISSYGKGFENITSLVELEGNKFELLRAINNSIDWLQWESIKSNMNKKPIMSVLRDFVEDCNPVINYAMKRKQELISVGFAEDDACEQALIDAKQYDVDLQKLLNMLSEKFSGEFSSLTDLRSYLRLKIQTDKEEDRAELERDASIFYVEGLTVHGAKGLEFDNVIIPFMSDPFYQNYRSEIIFSKDYKDIGWVYRKNGQEIMNDNYILITHEENKEIAKEETRLLYVAMTRAKTGLYCMFSRKALDGYADEATCWKELLPEEIDDENYL